MLGLLWFVHTPTETCKECGKQIDVGMAYCPYCGEVQNK